MLLNFRIKALILFMLVSFNLPGIVLADTPGVFTGQVNTNKINVRGDARVGTDIICVLDKGELVEVVQESYDWYKIHLPKKAPSYIKKNLLECNNLGTDPVAQSDKCLSAKVTKDRVNIRLGPSESAWILGKVNKATIVNIVAQEGDWYKIDPVYESYGWVNKKFVDKAEQEAGAKEATVVAQNNPPVKLEAVPALKNNGLVIEGEVFPYGMVLWRTATHKLITSENKIYFLKGDRKSLNRLNYHKVKITGKLISQSASSPIVQIDILEALN